jgi:hypothetical protein
MENKKEICYTNHATVTDDMSLKPLSNINNNKSDFDDAIQQPVVFEDLPHNPSVVMDKIEQFWMALALFCETHRRTLQLVKITVLTILFHCYLFGAVAYYIQNKVNKIFIKIFNLISIKVRRNSFIPFFRTPKIWNGARGWDFSS